MYAELYSSARKAVEHYRSERDKKHLMILLTKKLFSGSKPT